MADVEKVKIEGVSYDIKDPNAVSVQSQSLTAAQQAQARTNIGVSAATDVYTKTETDTLLNGKISTTAKGTSNGVAELDNNGKVPSSQLPSFVDDVMEGYYKTDSDRFYEESTFTTLIEPVAGKSWVDIPANKSYRWTGSVYVRVDEGVQIGETADTAYAGNKGKANADAITAIKDGVSIDSFSDVETALAGKVDAVQGKGLSTNDYTSEEKTKLAGLENYDDTGIQGDISAIEEVIPSTATSQNQLATAADIPTDAVKYTEQSLTSEQQAQARENIGAAASDDIPTDAVKYTAQTLTDAQKTQARTNIGAVQSDWNAYNSGNPDFIKNKPLVKVGQGTGGNLISGTGLENNTNEAKKLNSIAHGRNVTANGNYSIAAGQYVQANNDYEIAYGRCNQSNADTAFSIGDGVDTQNRHNLMELKTDGRMFLNGNAVKTEGGDDNKLRLGQICGITDIRSSTGNKSVYQGFKNLLATSNTTSITFSSIDMSGNVPRSGQSESYQFGDFIGCRKAESTVEVAPLAGRTAGKTKTGAWILVESCYYMFSGCSGVTSLDLSMFDTSKVKDMRFMFYNCPALATLDISSFDMTNVIEYIDMFGSGSYKAGITTLKCPKINPHDDIPLPRTLYSQDGTAYTNLPVTTGTSIELRQSWT